MCNVRPLYIVVGAPISFRTACEGLPSALEAEFHSMYVHALEALYNKFKHA